MEIFIPFFFLVAVIAGIAGIVIAQANMKKTGIAWSRVAKALSLTFTPGGFMQRPRLTGSLHGCGITVETFSRRSGKHSRTYTRFIVTYPKGLGLGLQLTQEGFFSGISKLFGAQDIEVGDASFDKAVVVKGRKGRHRDIVAFLTPARRLRIHRLLMSFPGSRVTDSSIAWEHRGWNIQPGGTSSSEGVMPGIPLKTPFTCRRGRLSINALV